ncbi:MAG: c-type cytochrome [Sulfuriflexus sp.]|nr:c-type cytochrome [Sulfuriflexus sp.]
MLSVLGIKVSVRSWLVPVLMLISVAVNAAPNGQLLYETNCASCHGGNGKGGVGVPISLPSFLHSVPDTYLEKTIRYGRPGRVMPPFKYLSDAQIKAIVGHLRNFAPGKYPESLHALVKGDIKRGKKLFGQHCASCHGVNGEGGKGTGVTFSRPRELPIIAPSISNPGFLLAATDHMIKSTLMNGRQGTPMQSFLKMGLTEKDIDDLVSYVRSFENVKAKKKFTEESAIMVFDSPNDLKTTVENLKNAAGAENFRIIRVQDLEEGLVKKGAESGREVVIYFCNFQTLNEVLGVDPRVGLFLPCRVTVVEREGKVQVMAINPRYLSAMYNNDELDKFCDQMFEIYTNIIEEATL